MGLGFVNTDCFHDLLVRTVSLYWTELSSLIFLQPQANGLPPREQLVHANQADDRDWSFLVSNLTRCAWKGFAFSLCLCVCERSFQLFEVVLTEARGHGGGSIGKSFTGSQALGFSNRCLCAECALAGNLVLWTQKL